jgi:hypothetical protein
MIIADLRMDQSLYSFFRYVHKMISPIIRNDLHSPAVKAFLYNWLNIWFLWEFPQSNREVSHQYLGIETSTKVNWKKQLHHIFLQQWQFNISALCQQLTYNYASIVLTLIDSFELGMSNAKILWESIYRVK